jgi:hypothetical protein
MADVQAEYAAARTSSYVPTPLAAKINPAALKTA